MSNEAKGPYRERLTDGGPYRVTKPGGKEDTYSDRDTASLACRLMNEAYAAGTGDTYAEITRLRRSLNMIAWPGSFGINSDQATPEMYRHIAQDTLAIGAVGATIRREKFAAEHPPKSGDAYSVRESVWGDTTVYVVEGPQGGEMSCMVEEYAHENCRALNRAHSFALTSQAARVRELEEALSKAIDFLDGCVEDHNFDFGHEFDEIKSALTPKEPQQ